MTKFRFRFSSERLNEIEKEYLQWEKERQELRKQEFDKIFQDNEDKGSKEKLLGVAYCQDCERFHDIIGIIEDNELKGDFICCGNTLYDYDEAKERKWASNMIPIQSFIIEKTTTKNN